MMDVLNNLWNLIKQNWIISVAIAVFAFIFLMPKTFKRLVGGKPKRRRRRTRLKTVRKSRNVTRRRSPVRSVGTKGYPAVGGGYIPFRFNKDGTKKKAWQVGGTVAAKRRMSRLRRNR